MPAGEAPANYYLRLLDRRLPNEQGEPLTTPLMGDFRVDNISGYFSDIAKRVRLAYEIDETAPHLPGLEPLPPSPEEIAKKEQRAVAAVRSRKGADAILHLMATTFEVDNLRSTYHYQKSGLFVPIEGSDTPDSLYTRSIDPIDRLFEAAATMRLVPSVYTRGLGERAIREGYASRESGIVLPLVTVTGRNTERERRLWLRQLEQTTEGLRYVPKKAVDELMLFAASRPSEYIQKPDLFSEVAKINRMRTGRYKRTA